MAQRVFSKSRSSGTLVRKIVRPIPAACLEFLEREDSLSHTWFVATTGANTNPGTITSPFKTIQYAADKAGSGDTVYVRAGVYHETVTVHHSGSSGKPIDFKPYNNESVTIDGADPITGFTNTRGSIWTANVPIDLGAGQNQVFVDNQLMNEARWPNNGFDLSHPVLATVASATATTTTATITDPAITQPAGFWDGGSIRIGSGAAWVNQTGTITDSGAGYVTFNYIEHDTSHSSPQSGNKYYLFGVPGALDAKGEWFRSSSGALSLWTPTGDSPAKHLVEVKSRLYGFDVSQASNIRIEGFHFFACTINTSSSSSAVVINGITAQYLSQFTIVPTGWGEPFPCGIILKGNNDTLENSVIVGSAGDGVYVAGRYDVVYNNLIHDTDYAGVDAGAIRVGGYRATILHNTCYNTGRNGLLFSGSDATITYNDVSFYGLQCQDLGGFYAASYNGMGTVIAYNKFHDGATGGYGGTGIMFDNGCSNFTAYRNITWNVNTGLRIVGAPHNLQIYNNTFDGITWSIDKDSLMDDWTGIIIENNILTHPILFGDNVQLIDNISNHGQFVAAANGNFALVAGAPAIDTGMLLSPYTNGYRGAAPDVGALEYGVAPFFVGATVSKIPKDPSKK